MGFFSDLLGSSLSSPSPISARTRQVGLDCYDTVIVVGTEYRATEVRAVGPQIRKGGAWAVLEAEPNNPHDRNAVRVVILGKTVGYLSGYQARQYADAVSLAGNHGELISARAIWETGPSADPMIKLLLPNPGAVVGELKAAYKQGASG